MTTMQATLNTYRNGETAKAYEMFLADPNANAGIDFARFCVLMNKSVARAEEQEAYEIATRDNDYSN